MICTQSKVKSVNGEFILAALYAGALVIPVDPINSNALFNLSLKRRAE